MQDFTIVLKVRVNTAETVSPAEVRQHVMDCMEHQQQVDLVSDVPGNIYAFGVGELLNVEVTED